MFEQEFLFEPGRDLFLLGDIPRVTRCLAKLAQLVTPSSHPSLHSSSLHILFFLYFTLIPVSPFSDGPSPFLPLLLFPIPVLPSITLPPRQTYRSSKG